MDRLIDGRYRILEERGSGGMGAVFRVRDESSGRVLALKILAAAGERERERLLRFRREFRAASLLVHPNIVQVHEFVSGRLSYFTMEFIEGRSVAAYLGIAARRPSPAELNQPDRVRRLFSILHQILLALGYIHEHHIVHRDLKPENILVADAPAADGASAPRVTVMDFGLARDLKETVALTQPGTVLGTLSYLSPEQATGRSIDGRSDLYSLGVLLYLLLTGGVPFSTDSVSNIMWKHCSQPPEPPRIRNPGVNRFLESVCLKLLAKDPFDRYQTADELRRLVERAGRGSYSLPLAVAEGLQRLEPSRGQVFAPRMVGRDRELDLLRAAFAAAGEGQGKVLALSGPAGSGRSRLLGEAAEAARLLGAFPHLLAFDRLDPRPYHGLRAAFEALRGQLSEMTDAEALASIGPDGAALAALDPRFLGVRALARLAATSPPAGGAPGRAHDAFCHLLRSLGRRGPIVFLIDDVGDADELSIALLARLASQARAMDASDPVAALPAWSVVLAGGEDSFARLAPRLGCGEPQRLAPLGHGHCTLLVHSMLGAALLPGGEEGGLVDLLFAASGGSPGRIEPLVHLLVAEGVARPEAGRWVVSPERLSAFEARLRAPEGAARLLAGARRSLAESAGPAGEALLAALALLPRESSFELLAAAAGLEEAGAIDAVEALLRARLVVEGPGGARIAISSEDLRSGLFEDLSAATRRAVHGRAWRALESRPGADPILIAHHAWEAGEGQAALSGRAAEAFARLGARRSAALWTERAAAHSP